MRFGKILITSLLVPALISPAFAAGQPVRPTVKAVVAAPKQDRSLVVRSSSRAGAQVKGTNALMGLPLLLIVAGAVATAVAVAVVVDKGSSPGS